MLLLHDGQTELDLFVFAIYLTLNWMRNTSKTSYNSWRSHHQFLEKWRKKPCSWLKIE